MKPLSEWQPVEVGFGGAQIQLAVVGDAVVGEIAAVAEIVEAAAHVKALRQRDRGFDSRSQKREPYAYADLTASRASASLGRGRWGGCGIGTTRISDRRVK